jgi:tetratricopeptide (TPR) repeat protein
VLGNAYLAHFFSVSQNPRTLKQAMSAYRQAEKDIISLNTPELHHNKGIALKYEEDYVGALNCFARAQELDPTWDAPKNHERTLGKFLIDVKQLICLKGKLKTKRFNAMVQSIDSKSLGPLSTPSRKEPLKEVTFVNLTTGINEGKVVLGKVICSVHSDESVPFTFCITDKNSRCVAVNLYNLAPGKGVIIGDSVAIAEPNFSHLNVKLKGQEIEFDLVRVESPLALIINGKKASADFQAGIELSTFAKSD